ncbi:T9SS type A sorting domain-containing protein [Flavobacterium sp.]|uniref:T9SS type A sorting domain-containing protein n=1 Tax=Flavobacterium sp. TaxID=239 RepID=UPI003752A504
MKTKLFYLFIAVFLFSFSGKSQTCTPGSPYPHCISLIGPGVSDWSTDVYLTTGDGDVFTLANVLIKETVPGSGIGADIKFRRDGCWDTCIGNPAGYSSATGTGFPTGSGVSVPFGPNIQPTPGVWNVTFTLSTTSWVFTPGTPNPTVKILGTATTPSTGVSMFATSATTFVIKKLPLLAGNAQFEINTTPGGAPTLALLGGTAFPDGIADDPAKFIPVSAAHDYDVTLDIASGAYTFKIATFPGIALVGAAVGGWPGQPGNPGPIDVWQMATTDGITYTLNNVPIVPEDCVFRGGNDWAIKYGSPAFPTGTNSGGQNITVPPGNAGTYNVTLNATTGAYNFTKITYAIVGEAVGGWPGDPGNPGPLDTHQLSTVDGVNYTVNNLVCTNFAVGGGAKFRLNNAWAGGDWGGDLFPAGTKTGNNIPTVAGTYNLTVNVLTGAYNFGTPLAVKNFNAGSFKVYPNPAKTSWNITSNDDITSVQVYDMLGKSVYAKTASSKEVTVNGTELSKGVYFAKVSTANGSSTVKLVKE